jgi:hypothetical protein
MGISPGTSRGACTYFIFKYVAVTLQEHSRGLDFSGSYSFIPSHTEIYR